MGSITSQGGCVMISIGTYDEYDITIRIPCINLCIRGVYISIVPLLFRPFYKNNIGNKRVMAAWFFRFGPISGIRIKTPEEWTREWKQ